MAILTDVDIARSNGKDFVIYPLEQSSVTPLGYDLRIGYAIGLRRGPEGDSGEMITEGKLVLPKSSSTLIICKEHVWLSSRIVGTLHSKGSLAAKGLVMNSTTVDPNWKGQMTFLLHNTNEKDIILDVHAPFVTMILHETLTSTESGPERDPLTVAKDYGDLYGESFKTQLLEYFNDEANRAEKLQFDKLVHSAKLPSLTQHFRHVIKHHGTRGSGVLDRAYGFTVRLLLIVLFLGDLAFLTFALFFWVAGAKLLHIAGLHDPKYIIPAASMIPVLMKLLERPKEPENKPS